MTPQANLRRARTAAGVSQAELARRLGRDQAWVSRIERGDYEVSVNDYCAWLQVLGLRVDLTPVADEGTGEMAALQTLWRRMTPAQRATIIRIAELRPMMPDRILRGLILFAELQAQAETSAG